MSSHIFDGLRTLKVLVVPIGENSLFDAHFDLISSTKHVATEEIEQAAGKANVPLNMVAAFKGFKWVDGHVVVECLRYDVAVGHSDGTDYVDSAQRVLGVVGLINHPEFVGSSDNVDEELAFFTRSHPNLALRRLVVFNHDANSCSTGSRDASMTALRPLAGDPQSLEICPPEEEVDGRSHLETFLREAMTRACVKIFSVMLKEMQSCENCRDKNTFPRWLPTSMKMGEAGGGSGGRKPGPTKPGSDEPSADDKKRHAGRLLKFMGDVSLQVCSPVDALEHFSAAAAACLANGDHLWHAAALEGHAAAMLTLLDQAPAAPVLEAALGKDLKAFRKQKKSKSVARRVLGVGGSIVSAVARAAVAASNALDDGSTEGADAPTPSSASSSATALRGGEGEEGDTVEMRVVRLAHHRCLEALGVYAARGEAATAGRHGASEEKDDDDDGVGGGAVAGGDARYACREATCALRVAEMLEEIGFGLTAGGGHADRHQEISDYVLRAVSVPGLSPTQRVEVTARGALVFRRAGLKRKYAMLLYMAALMSAECGKTHTAHKLMQKCCDVYGAAGAGGVGCWGGMRVQLLAHAAHVAREAGDAAAAAAALAGLLDVVAELSHRQQQQVRAWTGAGGLGRPAASVARRGQPHPGSPLAWSYFAPADRAVVAALLADSVSGFLCPPDVVPLPLPLPQPPLPLHGHASAPVEGTLVEKNLKLLSHVVTASGSGSSAGQGQGQGRARRDSVPGASSALHPSTQASLHARSHSPAHSHTAAPTESSQTARFTSPLFSTPRIIGIAKVQ